MLPKFYYLNLDKCKERNKHMENFFSKLDNILNLKINYKRINAFDATSEKILEKSNNLLDYCSLPYNKLFHSRKQGRKLKLAEFGCIYSHFLAYEAFLNDENNKNDFAVICEDDIDLFRIKKINFLEILNIVYTHIKTCGIISLSCVGSPILIENISKQINGPILLDYKSHQGTLYGTGCYIITREYATKIINKYFTNKKINIDEHHESLVADHFLYPQSEKTTFLIPSLFTIRLNNESYIHPEHVNMQENNQKIMFNMWNKFGVTNFISKSLISNNEWGIDYLKKNNNSPTIGTQFKPEDYIVFLENFDKFIKAPIVNKINTNTNYQIGILKINDNLKVEVHFINDKKWENCEKIWNKGLENMNKDKSNLFIKMCDREFKGKFTNDHLKRFLNLDFPSKTIFISEYKFKDKGKWDVLKKYNELEDFYNTPIKIIPIEESDKDKESCPISKKLFKLCGVS